MLPGNAAAAEPLSPPRRWRAPEGRSRRRRCRPIPGPRGGRPRRDGWDDILPRPSHTGWQEVERAQLGAPQRSLHAGPERWHADATPSPDPGTWTQPPPEDAGSLVWDPDDTVELLHALRDARRAAELAERLADVAARAVAGADIDAAAALDVAVLAERTATAAVKAAERARALATEAARVALELRERSVEAGEEATKMRRLQVSAEDAYGDRGSEPVGPSGDAS